jgi:hypothetical protein
LVPDLSQNAKTAESSKAGIFTAKARRTPSFQPPMNTDFHRCPYLRNLRINSFVHLASGWLKAHGLASARSRQREVDMSRDRMTEFHRSRRFDFWFQFPIAATGVGG